MNTLSCPARNRVNNRRNDDKYHINRKNSRKSLQNKQMAKFRLLAVMLILCALILPRVFFGTYDNLFLNKLRNSYLHLPDNISFFNSVQTDLANSTFLGKNTIGEVNFTDPVMKTIPLSGEMKNLTIRLKNLAAQHPFLDVGIFIWDYSTGNYVSINADQEFPTASMIKLPILFQLFRRSELGLVNLNDIMPLEPYYVAEGSGFLQYKPIGTRLPVYNLAQLMIQESDNTATNMILSVIGGVDETNKALRLWGFSQTHLSNWLPDLTGTNVSTPKDMGTILYNVDNADFLSLESQVDIVRIMSHVKNRHLIQAGLPKNVQFIHKTGDIGTMLGDAGIVMLPDGRKYIISIMVKRPWNSFSAKQFIIDASKTVYNSYVSGSL